MDYQTFLPSEALSAFVKCYWTLQVPGDPPPQKQRIVSDGCIELIFTLADDIKRYTELDQYIIQPRSMVLGQITKPFFIQPLGVVNTFAVRFVPGGFLPFFAYPIKKLENCETPLNEILGDEQADDLESKINGVPTTVERIELIEQFLWTRLREGNEMDGVIQSTIDLILATKGSVSIGTLSKNNASQRRQLERRFAKVIGLGPKQLARVIRLQTALKLMLDGDVKNLTDLAYDTNYYDQAHFIKEFKAFTGVSPKKFYQDENLRLSSLFYKE